MHLLHIVTPSHLLTSPELLGLIRLTQQQVGGVHKTIVIGSSAEAKYLRKCGIYVSGSVDGVLDMSRILVERVSRLVEVNSVEGAKHIIAWGAHATSAVGGIKTALQKIAFVDGLNQSLQLRSNDCMIIPTSCRGSTYLQQLGVASDFISEPLIGVEPTAMVASRSIVLDLLNLDESTRMVGVIGNNGSWKEVLDMVFRIKTTGERVVFILPPYYAYRSQLILAARKHGIDNLIIDIPPALRLVDVCAHADCAWVPSVAEFDSTYSVLDVLKVAWEDVPLAVQSSHAVCSVPTIGKKIAWARDVLDISSWMLDILRGSTNWEQPCTQVTTSIRLLASTSRFIGGLQQRISVAPTLRCC